MTRAPQGRSRKNGENKLFEPGVARPGSDSDFLVHGGFDPLPSLDLIDEAITILSRHPFIGPRAEYGMRELVISLGRTGYIALDSYEAAYDAVLIYAVRHQREAGYHNKP